MNKSQQILKHFKISESNDYPEVFYEISEYLFDKGKMSYVIDLLREEFSFYVDDTIEEDELFDKLNILDQDEVEEMAEYLNKML